MKFPTVFLKVFLKTYPEIKDIIITQHIEQAQPTRAPSDYFSVDIPYRFLVNVELIFNQGYPVLGNQDYYCEKIKTLFQLIFPNNDNISFMVDKLIVPKPINPHSRDEFYKIWE